MSPTRKFWLRLMLLAVIAAAPTAAQVWTTIGGNGTVDFADGDVATSMFALPAGVAVGAGGNVYVGDLANYRVRMLNAATSTWSTIGGNGTSDFLDGTVSVFKSPAGVAVSASGNVYVADADNNRIRMFTANPPTWSTIGGNGAASEFNAPQGVAVGADGNVYVADSDNHRIRIFNAAISAWSDIGGNGTSGFADGGVADSRFYNPAGVAVGADGNVYVGDLDNHRIRMFTAATSTWSTIGGNGAFTFADGGVTASRFNAPRGVAVGAGGNIYVADLADHRIRMFTAATSTWSTIGGNGMPGFADGDVAASRFTLPIGVAVGGDGKVYVAEAGNNRIRMFTPPASPPPPLVASSTAPFDDSWIGIPIGCSLVRGTLRRHPCRRTALAHKRALMRFRNQ